MPRTDLPVVDVVDAYEAEVSANELDFAFTPCDVGNGNAFVVTGRELLLARNVNAGAQSFDLLTAADERGRKADVLNYSLGPGEFAAIGQVQLAGWRQSDGKVHVNGDHADIHFAVLRLA